MYQVNGKTAQNNYEFYVIVEEQDIDVVNNKRPLKLKLYIKNVSKRFNSTSWTVRLGIRDISEFTTFNLNINSAVVGLNESLLVYEKIIDLPYDNGKEQTVTIEASMSKDYYSVYDPGLCTIEGELNLPRISKASIWNFTETQMNNIEDTLVLKINKFVNTYKNTVTVSNINNKVIVRTIDNVEDGYELKFTKEELELIYTIDNNSETANLKFYLNLYTYDENNNLVGEYERVVIYGNLLNANPIFTCEFEETNQNVIDVLGTTIEYIIKSASKPKITVNATALKGAKVKTISVVNGNQANANTIPYVFENVQTGTFTITVTDSRGLSCIETVEKPMIDYTPVRINDYSVKREGPTSANIILNASITCFKGSFNSIQNVPQIFFKVGSEGTLQEIANGFTFENNKVTFSNYDMGAILPYKETNKIYLYALDLLTEDTENYPVSRGVETFSMGEHDVQSNGNIFMADENGNNKLNLFDLINISEDEAFIGYFFGEKWYRKTIALGELPNTGEKIVGANLTGLDTVVFLIGTAINTVNKNAFPLPYVSNNNFIEIVYLGEEDSIRITTNTDRSNLIGYATVFFKKRKVY